MKNSSSFLGSKMMPYSTSYIDQIMGLEKVDDEDEYDSSGAYDGAITTSDQTKEISHSSVDTNQLSFITNIIFNASRIPIDNCTKTFVEVPNNLAFYVSGFCYITLLKGKLLVNGFNFPVGERFQIKCPVWQPAYRAYAASSAKIKNCSSETISLVCKGANSFYVSEMSAYLSKSTGACCFVVEGIPRTEQEWLIAAEDQTVYSVATVSIHPPISSRSKGGPSGGFVPEGRSLVGVESCLLGSLEHFSTLEIDVMTLPGSWVSGCDAVSARLSEREDVRAVVCGAKGVGKSSCLRHLVNHMLSHSAVDAVCVIDCDLGQPELTVPGVVSLHMVSKPLLSAPHFNLHSGDRKAELSFFLGDLTSRHEPELLISFFKLLVQRYNEIAAQCAEKHASKATRLVSNISANNFSALLLVDDEDQDGSDRSSKRKRVELRPTKVMPLVVNTDGFVRYMGAEVLVAVMGCVLPTNVLHLRTEKDKTLPALERLPVEQQGCVVSILEPGRLTAAKVAAVDLRALRLVSYFLGQNSSLRNKVREPSSSSYSNNNNTSGNSGNSSNTIGALAAENKSGLSLGGAVVRGIYIRNGTIVDPDGFLALALLSEPPYIVPFEHSTVLSLTADVSPCHLLASLNGSLVGLVQHLPNTANAHATALACRLSDGSECKFDLNSSVGPVLHHCIGMALVRVVDVSRQHFVVLCPGFHPGVALNAHDGQNSGSHRSAISRPTLGLIRGSSSLQLPNALIYAPGLPCFPYLSSESCGEGSTKMKARNNVKRRGQQAK